MIDLDELARICDARDVLCKFCECDECEKCRVQVLVDDAFAECLQRPSAVAARSTT